MKGLTRKLSYEKYHVVELIRVVNCTTDHMPSQVIYTLLLPWLKIVLIMTKSVVLLRTLQSSYEHRRERWEYFRQLDESG